MTTKTPSKRRKARLAALIRRRDFLAERVADHRGDPAFDIAELGALNWAIQVVRAAAQEDILEQLEQLPVYDARLTA